MEDDVAEEDIFRDFSLIEPLTQLQLCFQFGGKYCFLYRPSDECIGLERNVK